MTAANDARFDDDDHNGRVNSVAVDPAATGIRVFIRGAIPEGLIRTTPTGRGRVLNLPSALEAARPTLPHARQSPPHLDA